MEKQPYSNKMDNNNIDNKSILVGDVYVNSIGYIPILDSDPNKRITDVGAMTEVTTTIIDGKKTLEITCTIPFSYDQQEMKRSVAEWYATQAAE